MRIFILLVCLLGALADDSTLTRKPNETEIFHFLITDTDWTDVLYLCDFSKTFTFSCNVTVQGAESLKNSSAKTQVPTIMAGLKEQQPKFAIINVSGTWSLNDGIIKQNYVSVDYLDIIAKCLFRVNYYECFGVPRCDGHGGMAECHGGEPWRGHYVGAPNVGFTGNITNMAMESEPMPHRPRSSSPLPTSASQVLITPPAPTAVDGLPSNNQINDTGALDQTVITLTNASGTFTSTGSGADFPGAVEVPANGSLSIVKVLASPTVNRNGTTSGGVQVSSFASFSSGGGSSNPNDTDGSNSNNNVVNFNVNPFDAFAFPGFGFANRPRHQRPNVGFLPRDDNNNSTGTGSDSGLGAAAGSASSSRGDPDNCSNRAGDFGQSLRCMIQNFQRTIFNSMLTSFQVPNFQPLRFDWSPIQPQSPFNSAQPPQQQPSSLQRSSQQFQSQSMGSLFQSQQQPQQQQLMSRSFFRGDNNGVPHFGGGFRVLIVPDNAPQFQGTANGGADDDALTGWFRK